MRNLEFTVREPDFAIRCRGITKEFGNGDSRTVVLRGVELDVHLGKMTMLVGQSGCGKTTLLSVIAGLVESSGGDLEVLGVFPDELKENDRIRFRRENLGFAFQQFNLLPALTAAENVAVPLLAGGIPRKRAIERGIEFLATLGMAHRARALPSELSGGEQQRVALARALVHDPKLIVCDEPTSALDGRTGHTVMELLSATAVRPDRAVIIVTHDARIFDFADQIAYMDDGRVKSVGQAGSLQPVANRPAATLVTDGEQWRKADLQS